MNFFGHVTPHGAMQLDRPELFRQLLSGRLADCRIQLTIEKYRTPRSQQQGAYLFAAVYPPIAEHTGYSIPEVHVICKQMFLPAQQRSIGERMITVPGSTTTLTRGEMVEYIDRVIALAGELGCTVQSPEEAGFISNSAPPVTSYEDKNYSGGGD